MTTPDRRIAGETGASVATDLDGAEPSSTERDERQPLMRAPEGYPIEVTDVASARAFLIEARDIHQQWADAINKPLHDDDCLDCVAYRAWLRKVEESGIGTADWHLRWVRNYDLILSVLP